MRDAGAGWGKGMIRRLFNMLCGLSLLLCVATMAMWVRSYRAFDSVEYDSGNHRAGPFGHAWSSMGLVVVSAGTLWSNEDRPKGWTIETQSACPLHAATDEGVEYDKTPWARLGFVFHRSHGAVYEEYEVGFPHWFVVLLTVLWPMTAFRGKRQLSRRHKLGLCLACGYDLRASSDRCPECGTPIPADLEREPIQDSMKCRLFNILCGLSLLLCVASVVLWIKSYSVAQVLLYGFPSAVNPNIAEDFVGIGWSNGVVYLVCFPSVINTIGNRHGFQWLTPPHKIPLGQSYPTPSPQWLMSVSGIGWNAHNLYNMYTMFFPAQIPVILTAVLPALWIIRRYRPRPPRIGFCQKCGYNLTGNVSGICPECGTAIAAKAP